MTRIVVLLLTVVTLAGCKYMPKLDEVLPDKRSEYKKSQSLPDLEVPPDLSTESISDKMGVPDEDGATFSTYEERVAARKKARAEEGAGENAVEALSGEKVLVVSGSMKDVWSKLHDFWSAQGYELDLDDEEYGVQETKWREDKDNLVRDKYKIFAEAGEKAGTTTLYVSHDGEEMHPDGEGLTWKKRSGSGARDEIVAALQSAFGASSASSGSAAASSGGTHHVEVNAEGAAPAHLAELVNSGEGKYLLSYPGEVSEAWKRTGEALAAGGLTVTDSDESKGTYSVRDESAPAEKKGVLSKLAFWRSDKKDFQLSLTGVGGKTEIVVLDEDGKPDDSEAATQLLSTLRNQLNKGVN
ncbi:MAG: outer membrane protein assembly factor BamC [Gammaproteobacteria bacterium]